MHAQKISLSLFSQLDCRQGCLQCPSGTLQGSSQLFLVICFLWGKRIRPHKRTRLKFKKPTKSISTSYPFALLLWLHKTSVHLIGYASSREVFILIGAADGQSQRICKALRLLSSCNGEIHRFYCVRFIYSDLSF